MILLYHLVFPDSTPRGAWNAGLVLRLADFKRHLLWLKNHFQILPLDRYLAELTPGDHHQRGKYAITFDDGYRQVFDLIFPFLLKEQIPTTIFATTSHLEDHELLWFVYFNALCSEEFYSEITIQGVKYLLTDRRSSKQAWEKLIHLARESGAPISYARAFAQKYPLPGNIISKYEGLSPAQILKASRSGLINVEGHTHSHPYLDQISKEAQLHEMLSNKSTLEVISGKKVNYFAYTGGLYNLDSIDAVKEAGFKAAFAVTPRQLRMDRRYEIPRVDIYSSSMIKFAIKVYGVDKLIKH